MVNTRKNIYKSTEVQSSAALDADASASATRVLNPTVEPTSGGSNTGMQPASRASRPSSNVSQNTKKLALLVEHAHQMAAIAAQEQAAISRLAAHERLAADLQLQLSTAAIESAASSLGGSHRSRSGERIERSIRDWTDKEPLDPTGPASCPVEPTAVGHSLPLGQPDLARPFSSQLLPPPPPPSLHTFGVFNCPTSLPPPPPGVQAGNVNFPSCLRCPQATARLLEIPHDGGALFGSGVDNDFRSCKEAFYGHATPHTHTQPGTHYRNTVVNKNKNLNQDTQISELAKAIAALGTSRGVKKVSDMELPIFDGRTTDWLAFKRVFDHTRASFTPVENLARLSKAVRGAAREAVCTLLVSAETPEEVLQALETRFARPELMVLEQLSILRSLPKLPSVEGANELSKFACRVRTCVDTIRFLHQSEYLASPEIANSIIGKLSPVLRARWLDFASAHHHTRTRLELLSEFLFREADLHMRFGLVEFNSPKHGAHVSTVAAHTSTVAVTTTAPSFAAHRKICWFCQAKEHCVENCPKFRSIIVEDRWRWVSENKVCHKCLKRGGHSYRFCKKSCKVPRCLRSNHHSLLHRPTATVTEPPAIATVTHAEAHLPLVSERPETPEAAAAIIAHSSSNKDSKALLKVIPITLSGPSGNVETFALLDDGATATFIDAEVATTIGATGIQSAVEVNCIGGLKKTVMVSFVDILVRGRYSNQIHTIKNVRAIPNLGITEQSIEFANIEAYEYLSDIAEQLCYQHGKPTIIIGADNWHLTIPLAVRRGTTAQPAATLTRLGWVLYGFVSSKTTPVHFINHSTLAEPPRSEEESLDALIRENYKLDAIGISKISFTSVDNKRAADILEATTRRLPSGHYETGLLWRENLDPKNIPCSRNLALSRFKSLERKFHCSKSYSEAYKKNIKATLDKGYAEPCDETTPTGRVEWFLPHFGVVHPQKKKLRVVHDAKACCQGVSLNSMLLTGPDLLQPLLAILMRFREGPVALNADIREMYPQIKIRSEDRDAQRFLWRENPSQPIKTYRMSSMIFGAASSPFTAIYLKNKNAEGHKQFFPKAADVIVNDHYMDDLLLSVDSLEEATQLAADVVRVHSFAGFEMRSWVSNCPDALSRIPSELRGVSITPDGKFNPSAIRTLGVWWNLSLDTLQLVRGPTSSGKLQDIVNKRIVLSQLMSVYDPLGFLSPLIVKGKIIFQRTWKHKIDWSDPLPLNLVAEWAKWSTELEQAATISIPRCYTTQVGCVCRQLHIFADASELAYACVAYWRIQYDGGGVKLALIGGKTRLAPVKPTTIPRLELQAALIAARFSVYISEAHRHKPDSIWLWSDSMTVLRWLRSDAKAFKPFVAHRVGEITELTKVEDWRYVPTQLNVADDATRPNTQFDSSCRWLLGPSFLNRPFTECPTEPIVHQMLAPEELKKRSEQACPVSITQRSTAHLPLVADPTRFNSWTRLVRATASIYKAVKLFRSLIGRNDQNPYISGDIGVAELVIAENKLFLYIQLETLGEEHRLLRSGSHLPKNSKLKSWAVTLDDSGLIRLMGRTGAFPDRSTFDPNPVVLDGRHFITRLLVRHHHVKAAHANQETVVNELRQRFYILSLRPAVKAVSAACLFCKIKKGRPVIPPFGNLPPERLAAGEKPFTFVGLDYFGPMSVSIGRRSEKRYVALFTCLTVRAVHLEVVGSLTSDAAIMALRRFIARRGCPTTIFSDNGTAFVGADRVISAAADFRIKWKFIPPAAPFMGGCWERLVRSVKVALGATLRERTPREEVLCTLLCEAEALINSRPLTHVSVDPLEEESITPNHFLLGSSSPYWPVTEVDDSDLVRRVSWRKGLRLADHFWSRWVREYLPQLSRRTGSGTSTTIREGDVVLIADGTLPRGTWPRGRVLKTFPGNDGVVRVVDVDTRGGVLRRPVRKLVPLN